MKKIKQHEYRKWIWNRGMAFTASLLVCAGFLAGCELSGNMETETPQESGGARQSAEVSQSDYASGRWDNWQSGDYVSIQLNGASAEADGTGVIVEGSAVTVKEPGVYVFSGSMSDGQIIVDAGKEDVVQLVLNGVDLSCADSAPIYSRKAGTTVLTLVDGTENTIQDGAEYIYPDSETDEPDAAVFAKNDLIITGIGSLTVTGSYNNGIGSKDDLVMESGTLSVVAANHGIRGRDSVTILNGDITIQAGNDGIQSNNDSGEGKGWILLEGGTCRIHTDHDGIQAETTLTITGGEYHLVNGGGSDATPEDLTGSYKGLKAGTDLVIRDGVFRIDSADDTVHANGNVTISGGTFDLASGDDGIHADDALTITGGVIDISTSYEGLEGQTVEISGGTIRLVASDDGINAAGGNDEGTGGRFGADRFAASENNHISISGGYVVVTASGDGIDSNGNVYMSGGTLIVHGPVRGGDAPLDFDGSFELTGGVLVAAGSSGMAQAPGSSSTQATLQVYFTSTMSAGTPVHLADSQDNPLLTFTPASDYQNIVISLPELEQGQTYRLYTGGSDAGEEQDGLVLECSYGGGVLLSEVTLSDITTRVSDTGEAVSGGMGMGGMGGGGRGGMGGEPPEGEMPPGGRGGPGGGREAPEGMPGDGPGRGEREQ